MSLPAFAFAVPSSNRVCVVRTRDVHWKSRPREGGSGRGAAGGSSVSREGGRGETRRDRRARAAVVFISRETPLHWPKSSPVCCHSTLRRRSVRQPHRAAPPGEPLECGNSPRSVRRPRASDDVHCCLPEPVSRNLFKAPEYIKSQQGGGGLLSATATATAAPRSVEIRGRFQRRGGKSFAAVVVGAASESHQDLYAPPRR